MIRKIHPLPVRGVSPRDVEFIASRVKLEQVVFFGGGTGGHLTPGLALAEKIRQRHPACRLTLFRTRREIESTVTAGGLFESVLLDLSPPTRPVRFARELGRAVETIREHLASAPIDAAIGLGGYPSVPGILAARCENIPLILLEQNAVGGKVNRLLGPLARMIACPGEESVRSFGPLRHFVGVHDTGNPVRTSVEEARRWRLRLDPDRRRRQAGAPGRRVLLVMGGSQGSRPLNDGILELLRGAPRYREKIFVIHVAGPHDVERVRAAYRSAGWMAKVSAYEPDLPIQIACADLVVARSGGSSVSELAAVGVPSILVPYPGHRDQHQTLNARGLCLAGGCQIIDQARFLAGGKEQVLELLFDTRRLEQMEERALAHGRIDAADRLVDLIEEVAP